MATPQEKLAESLEALEALQKRDLVAIRSSDLSRTHRERLLKSGFLREVMKGWYIPSKPDEPKGESTAWYTAFWRFCAAYLNERFGEDWSLSPEQSLLIHTGNYSVPRQLLVRSPKARNRTTNLAYGTSIFESRAAIAQEKQLVIVDGLRLFSLEAALVASGPGIFMQSPAEMCAALVMVRDASAVLHLLLEGGHTIIGGRLAGAFRNIGRDKIAKEIVETMQSAGYNVRENDPFEKQTVFSSGKPVLSPYVTRMRANWLQMREEIVDKFPKPPGLPGDAAAYLNAVDEVYVDDAYNSLSIEGYRVSRELVERVREGKWNPQNEPGDREHGDAMAAKGYYDAFQAVKRSVARVLHGESPGRVADEDHGGWYRQLFSASVAAGIVKPADLAGYRNGQVYIRHSRHVPPRPEAVRDLMPALFELLDNETEPGVRVVLGHFMFVFIHPYMDGNGRMGRFLMNLMLAAGGYPWTVVPVEQRNRYMETLESASTESNVIPFTEFLASLVREQ